MEKINVNLEISRLLSYGEACGLLHPADRVYAANRILALLGLGAFSPVEISPQETPRYPAQALSLISSWAQGSGALPEDTPDAREQLETELMACMTPRPSQVIDKFNGLYKESPQKATEYFYGLSCHSNYIHMDRVEKDKKWSVPTPYGDLDITINLSKPEKDPKDIAAAKNAPQSGYPICALCRENEGFKGSANQAPRGNHRIIPLQLEGESWFLQYSPYVYYHQHCIFFCGEHRPMKIDRQCFSRLLTLTQLFPHYFVGSNADLPIVGGSILTHDHFQGGLYEFPMAKAPIKHRVDFHGVQGGIVNWPMSTLRLRCDKKEKLIDLAAHILGKWRGYSDETADILAFSGDTPHNTITPIARRRGELYELDLVLRNNRTTPQHPMGIFHPHSEYHHIKKENIGLIEVMGLAILPPRILTESELVIKALEAPGEAAEIFSRPEMEKHLSWYNELKENPLPSRQAVENSIGEIFGKILGNAGVFKDTPEGAEAFLRFCGTL